ncbi:conserved hypothetical protein [Vibrio crassostreae]|nr:conserved hypothetical protein [Vibrio crassostreae]
MAGKEVNCCVLGNKEVATTSSTMASDSITGGGRDKSMFESTTVKYGAQNIVVLFPIHAIFSKQLL